MALIILFSARLPAPAVNGVMDRRVHVTWTLAAILAISPLTNIRPFDISFL